ETAASVYGSVARLNATSRVVDLFDDRNMRKKHKSLVEQDECARFARVLRDLFGNPFRLKIFDPGWRTSTVVPLARHIYDERAYELMPILADALDDARCTDADILHHCRQPEQRVSNFLDEIEAERRAREDYVQDYRELGDHFRGCWVVDLILQKQ